jgi:hypothetical protein
MSDLSEAGRFYGVLHTTLSRQQVAELFRPLASQIRKCGWDEFEIICPWAELVIESESPIPIHGLVAEVHVNAERLLTPLREAGIAYSAECYGKGGELLQEFR